MKKNSKIALLLALMMSMSTVFAACSDEEFGSSEGGYVGEGGYTGGGTVMTGPAVYGSDDSDMASTYKERIAKWTKYLEYETPELAKSAEELVQLTQKETDTYETMVDSSEEFLVVATRDTSVEGLTKITQEIRLLETNELLFSFENKNYDAIEDRAQCVSYGMNGIHNTILEVAKTTYALRDLEEGEEEVDATVEANYVQTVTYSYYDIYTKEAIAVDLEERAVVREEGAYLDIADKTYAMNEDGIVKVFDKGMEYGLPTFNKDNEQYVEGSRAEYVYVEQGEYGYRINEAPSVSERVGDLYMTLFPGISVDVYKDHELVATHETDCYTVSGFGILPNGNVYVCEYRLVKDEAKADVISGDYMFDIVHTVLDVKTGVASEVNNSFIASRVFTNTTREIKTWLNCNTTLLSTGIITETMIRDDQNHMAIQLKDGYVLAEITKYENGALTGNSAFAVLDENTLQVVEELPKIVDSQMGYAGYVSEEEVLFATRTVDNKIVRYTVNTKTGELNLFKKSVSGMKMLAGGGFLLNKTVYDYEWNTVADLSGFDEVIYLDNGTLLLKDEKRTYDEANMSWSVSVTWYTAKTIKETKYEEVEDKEHYGWITVEKEVLYLDKSSFTYGSLKNGLSSVDVYGNCFALTNEYDTGYNDERVVNTTFYDFEGKKLFDLSVTTDWKTFYEMQEGGVYYNYNKYVRYKISTGYQVQILADGKTVMVSLRETWEETAREGYTEGDPNDVPTVDMDGKTYDQYFILK